MVIELFEIELFWHLTVNKLRYLYKTELFEMELFLTLELY